MRGEYRNRTRASSPIVPKAGPLKITRADGSSTIRPPLTEQQARRIIGRKRGSSHQ